MRVTAACGHTFDDEHYSYTCYDDGHYPLFTSPETYCKRHDLYRPCAGCDEGIGPSESMRRDDV